MVDISPKEYALFAEYIKKNYGINLGGKKQALIVGRLQNILFQNDFKNFSEYYNFLTSDTTGNAIVTFINQITTNHTFFMREAEHFIYMKEKVLPYLARELKQKDLRIWSAGCSTGEEPYTLAMIIDEYFGFDKKYWDTRILATDISSKVLEIASKAQYSDTEIASLPVNWKINYFKKHDNDMSVVVDRIKNEVIFRKFNLIEKVFPFKQKFNVIFCRNVMIYFDNDTKDKLVEKFYDLLDYGGYLFIGHSESLNREKTRFKYVMPAVFRKE